MILSSAATTVSRSCLLKLMEGSRDADWLLIRILFNSYALIATNYSYLKLQVQINQRKLNPDTLKQSRSWAAAHCKQSQSAVYLANIFFQLSFLKMNMHQPFSAAVIDLLLLDLLAGIPESSLCLPMSSMSLRFGCFGRWLSKMLGSLFKTNPLQLSRWNST